MERFDYVGSFIDGLAKVQREELYGVINDKEEIIVPIIYDFVNILEGGLARVFLQENLQEKEGVVNTKGEFVEPLA